MSVSNPEQYKPYNPLEVVSTTAIPYMEGMLGLVGGPDILVVSNPDGVRRTEASVQVDGMRVEPNQVASIFSGVIGDKYVLPKGYEEEMWVIGLRAAQKRAAMARRGRR